MIGAGFGHTGTLTLKTALEQLGFGPRHHMTEVIGSPAQIPFWNRAAAGDPVPNTSFPRVNDRQEFQAHAQRGMELHQ